MSAPTLDYGTRSSRRPRAALKLTIGSLILTAGGLLLLLYSMLNSPNILANFLLFISVVPVAFFALVFAAAAMILRRTALTGIALLLAATTLALPFVFASCGMIPKAGYGP